MADTPHLSRVRIIDLARLLARDRSATNPSMTSDECINVVSELYLYIRDVGEERIRYFTLGAGAALDGFGGGTPPLVLQDNGLSISGLTNPAGAWQISTNRSDIDKIYQVMYEGSSLLATTVQTYSGTELELIQDHTTFLAIKAKLGTGSAPRYYHARRRAAVFEVGANTGYADTSITPGSWQILVAPSKALEATLKWAFSIRGVVAFSQPGDGPVANDATSPLVADATIPECFPHEQRWMARMLAAEMILRTGGPMVQAQRVIRNVPEYLRKSRKLGVTVGT